MLEKLLNMNGKSNLFITIVDIIILVAIGVIIGLLIKNGSIIHF